MSSKLKIAGNKNKIKLEVTPETLEIKGSGNDILVIKAPVMCDNEDCSRHRGAPAAGSSAKPAPAGPVHAADPGVAPARPVRLRAILDRDRSAPYPVLPAPGLLAIKDRE